jgi:hypothetical protein
MTLSEELITHIRDTVVPDKKRILRTRYLARELGRGIQDRAMAKTLVQRLNNTYLTLQLATLSDDPQLSKNCRNECVGIVLTIDRACAADRGDRQGPVLERLEPAGAAAKK